MERFLLTDITKSLCNAIKIQPPTYATSNIDVLDNFVQQKTCGQGVSKIVVFNPDAIGEWVLLPMHQKSYLALFFSFHSAEFRVAVVLHLYKYWQNKREFLEEQPNVFCGKTTQ